MKVHETKRIDGAKFVKIFLLSKYTAQNIKIFVKISQKLSRWKFCAIFVDILMCTVCCDCGQVVVSVYSIIPYTVVATTKIVRLFSSKIHLHLQERLQKVSQGFFICSRIYIQCKVDKKKNGTIILRNSPVRGANVLSLCAKLIQRRTQMIISRNSPVRGANVLSLCAKLIRRRTGR